VPDNCLAFPTQTGRGLLEQVATEKNVALDEATLALAYDLGLEPHLDKRFEQMSTGTWRKVFVTAAALGDPAVVIADGPSNGFDARGGWCWRSYLRPGGRIGWCCLRAMMGSWWRGVGQRGWMLPRCGSGNWGSWLGGEVPSPQAVGLTCVDVV